MLVSAQPGTVTVLGCVDYYPGLGPGMSAVAVGAGRRVFGRARWLSATYTVPPFCMAAGESADAVLISTELDIYSRCGSL